MGSIIDYARTETRGFGIHPFREADALVLAQLSYDDVPDCMPRLEEVESQYGTLRNRVKHFDFRHPFRSVRMLRQPPFDGISIARADDELHHDQAVPDHDVENVGLVDPQVTHDFYHAIASNPRFSDIEMGAFLEQFDGEEQTQFAAVTYRAAVRHACGGVPRHRRFAGRLEGRFQHGLPVSGTGAGDRRRLSGQSRRAVEGRADCAHRPFQGRQSGRICGDERSDEVKDRVERIYSLDGPGFPESVVNSFEYASVSDRIVKIVPDSSVVGMVLETPERCIVVKSDVEGIMQHFAFSWQMHGGEFDKVEDVANSSVTFNKALNKWLSNLSKEQRERAVDALFAVLEASGAGSISAMMAAGPKVIPEMLGTYVGLSVEDRRNLNQALGIMLQAALARNPKVRRR